MNKKWAVVFPGQGSQKVGMGADLLAQDAYSQSVFKTANEVLGFDIRSVCLNGPEEVLKRTEFAQSGIFLISACLYPLITKRMGGQPDFVLGHSLGEVSAYYASGVFDLADALRVIKKRGEAMSQACQEVASEMVAVLGIDVAQIQVALSPFATAPISVANINSPNQVVVSGVSSRMPEAIEALKAAGAKRVIPLPVAGAFHSPLMNNASIALGEFLKTSISFESAQIPIVLNRTATPTQDAAELTANLPKQVISSVRWVESIANLIALVPDITFVECGPGGVLSGLIKKIDSNVSVVSVDSLEALAQLDQWLGE